MKQILNNLVEKDILTTLKLHIIQLSLVFNLL